MNETTADELRTRLVEIDDEIRGLAADDFSRRHELLTESDVCRASLITAIGPDVDEAAKEWAERAARKGSHEVDYEIAKALAKAVVGDGK